MKTNSILITGSHRSGTTWVGRVLNHSKQIRYVHEPLNKLYIPVYFQNIPNRWFLFPTENTSRNLERGIEKIITRKSPKIREIIKALNTPVFKRVVHDYLNILQSTKNSRTLLKDPIAIFASEWLYNKFNTKIILMVRSPLGFVSSIKKGNMRFDFNEIRQQPELIDSYLKKFEKEINEYSNTEHDLVKQGILLYNIIYSFAFEMKQKYPDWLFIKHEDLSADPITQFEKIFSFIDVEYTDRIKKYISMSTSDKNPADRSQKERGGHHINSKASISNWKNRLNETEINLILNKTKETSKLFGYDFN